jgi:photosystem II stability/assembly factor-like uncharacterized protein
LDQIDMLSPSLGYALATRPLKGLYEYYLVRTTDLARTWTVVSQIPGNNQRYPIFTDFSTYDSDPFIYFANRDIGYVDGPGARIDVTHDAGRTWKTIGAGESSTSYGVTGSTASVVATKCVTARGSKTPSCTTSLSEYAAGSTTAWRTRSIPGTKGKFQYDVALLASAPDATQVLSVDSDQASTPASLLVTRDDGETWSRLPNPCHGLLIEQMLVTNDGRWLLSCFLDQGMYHGTAKIFRSTDGGATWSTVVDDTALHNIVGNLGGTPVALFFSGNDRLLFAPGMNPAGGVSVSYDGGTHWVPIRYLGYTGGSPGSFTTFGPTSAIYQVFQGPIYVTRNNRTWRLLPELPAGLFEGGPICTSARTEVSLRVAKSGKVTYTNVDFTNEGSRSCYLDGAPDIQALGVDEAAVGPPMTTELASPGGNFVMLKARGGVANLSLLINTTSNFKPASTCDARRATSLRIEFGAPSQFHLSLGSHSFLTCTLFPSTNLTVIAPGPGKP